MYFPGIIKNPTKVILLCWLFSSCKEPIAEKPKEAKIDLTQSDVDKFIDSTDNLCKQNPGKRLEILNPGFSHVVSVDAYFGLKEAKYQRLAPHVLNRININASFDETSNYTYFIADDRNIIGTIESFKLYCRFPPETGEVTEKISFISTALPKSIPAK